ncbi:ATP-dependent Clp protease ATP-binding subunit ClpA [Cellulosilyticum ruminicola]|uniref:ATP-dependent Clp protease ATP-binding subunit ClpA n=1 Tax=Cellulosilyticum ruminicola TaxID=425254 RepID=UPI0006D221E8|nr:ATP-dependent Clp protease ATP-binding subunit ClpA [Cellulosilyticum ruminicola]
MYISALVGKIIAKANELAAKLGHEYITPEHIILVMCGQKIFKEAFESCGGDISLLRSNIAAYLDETMEKFEEIEPIESFSVQQALLRASEQVLNSGKNQIEVDHLLAGIMDLPENYGVYYILEQGVTKRDLLFELCHLEDEEKGHSLIKTSKGELAKSTAAQYVEEEAAQDEEEEEGMPSGFEQYITNLNKEAEKADEPLVGREDLIIRTIQVLCRKQKNNPIHVGEPGVGKTKLTLGLAKYINEGKVPDLLKGAQIYSLDLGSVLAGTQYRGDFEKRLKKILDSLKKLDKPIVYIDEIHNIVGAGALGGGSLDASNLLKPYLTDGQIKFIGATTYEEYKKYFEKDKGLVRRFQTVEVKEPTVEETIQILQGLKPHYEKYHGVTYTDEAIKAAAELSQQYINDRFLPDKAIDLIDETGACNTVKGKKGKKKVIDLDMIQETLSKICHIPKQTVEKKEVTALKQLEGVLKGQIFGQDQAIKQIVKSIKLSRAGLSDGNKSVANFLFVGPTGVGKTEIAKCLAKELGVKLIRFDMSEYTEKHTASKLIGSPPGYVGYEEGGLLTDAIRKTPYCVLLLDEIEKAHQDIFNILLQVMDYATLTDNQGRKADFRNVILIMTSNAGASRIGKKLVGFGERSITGDAIQDEVKKVFTPEFRNRLSSVVVFNHIDSAMADLIAKKELNKFKEILKEKNITLTFDKKCVTYIAEKGISTEFGAREIARLIEDELKLLLVDEILFGKLVDGGSCKVTVVDKAFKLTFKESAKKEEV